MSRISFRITGVAANLSALDYLRGSAGQREAFTNAFEVGGQAIKDKAQAIAPEHSGGYRRRIGSYMLRRELALRVRAFAPHSHLIEYGTKRRRPKKASVMSARNNPFNFFGDTVFGTKAKPMPELKTMREAVKRSRVRSIVEDELTEQVERIFEREIKQAKTLDSLARRGR